MSDIMYDLRMLSRKPGGSTQNLWMHSMLPIDPWVEVKGNKMSSNINQSYLCRERGQLV